MAGNNEYRKHHLEFIQGIISRQAQNSFTIKGWSLTLSAGIFTFLLSQDSTRQIHPAAYLIVVLPAVLFWFLDAYYLRQERLFRCLYDEVRHDIIRGEDKSSSVELYEMNATRFGTEYLYTRVLFNRTVFGIPLMILVASITLFSLTT